MNSRETQDRFYLGVDGASGLQNCLPNHRSNVMKHG